MEKKIPGSRDQEETINVLMRDIARGAKARLVDPLLEEERRLGAMLSGFQAQTGKDFQDIRQRLDRLEESIQQVPFLILSAIRDAISQAGVDSKH